MYCIETRPKEIKTERLPVPGPPGYWYSKTCLQSASYLPEDAYAAHSFYVGTVTTLAIAGPPNLLIQAMGHWSSECY